ncbi:MAG TPA: hypothetical protein VIN11_01495 [Roseivirga sp.]
MKDNRLDELFRNGLETHKITPPQNAWAKIEGNLPNKNKKGAYFWLSIAASAMLFATIGWLAFSNQDAAQKVSQEVLSEVKTDVTPTTSATPDALTAEVEVPIQKKKDNDLIDPIQSNSNPTLLIASSSIENSEELQESIMEGSESLINESFNLKIDLIQPTSFKKPAFVASNLRVRNINRSADLLMESVMLSPEEFEQIENEKGRRSGFISGIVSLAKGVNSGTKALSEIRKSKNEFITNDLKYGQKTDGSTEGTDEPPTKQE